MLCAKIYQNSMTYAVLADTYREIMIHVLLLDIYIETDVCITSRYIYQDLMTYILLLDIYIETMTYTCTVLLVDIN